MIRLEQLHTSYDRFDLQLDLEIAAGELVSILGPSGSGKTTTLRLIAGFQRPTAGRIVIGGNDVTALRPADRQIGYVFQDYTLFPHMSVAQNVGYGLRIRKQSSAAIARRVDELLELMELPGYGARRVATLSGGERQRVAIARALAVDPLLLLLDEPFSSIDEVLRRGLRREIVRLQKELGITVVFVTHSRREALTISDRVAILRGGRLVQYDTPTEVYRQPADEFVAGFVGEVSMIPHGGRSLPLRPEQVFLAPADSGAHQTDTTPTGGGSFSVTVRSREFLGSTWLYELASQYGAVLAYDTRRFQTDERLIASYLPPEHTLPLAPHRNAPNEDL